MNKHVNTGNSYEGFLLVFHNFSGSINVKLILKPIKPETLVNTNVDNH